MDLAWVQNWVHLVRFGSGIGPKFRDFGPFRIRPLGEKPGVLPTRLLPIVCLRVHPFFKFNVHRDR